MTKIVQQLRVIREDKRMSQQSLAEMTNISRVSISRYERGIIQPNIKALEKMAFILGYEIGLKPQQLPFLDT